jgi:hypothetical protein
VGVGLFDGGTSYLVEHHAPDRHLRLEHLDEMPGDGFALTILVCRQIDLVRPRQQLLELLDLALALLGDDIEGLEPVVHVDTETGPRLPLGLGGDLGGGARQITDVPHRGFDPGIRSEEVGDGAGLGG